MAHLTLAALPFEPSKNVKKIGRAGKIELDLRDLKLGTLPVSRAQLEFEDVRYDFAALKDRAQFHIVQSGAAGFGLQLSAEALLPAFAAKLQNTSDVQVSTQGKTLTLRGNRTILGATTPITVSGDLAGRGSELRLENTILTVGGARVPDAAANLLLKDLNPLYDFDKGLKWPFRTEITNVSGVGNQIELSANLRLSTPTTNSTK
jgi:hypothetical protein